MTQRFEVKGTCGLHARPALQFVELAKRFESNITIDNSGKPIDAKSLLAVLSAGISGGTVISITVEGSDEAAAMKALGEYLSVPLQ